LAPKSGYFLTIFLPPLVAKGQAFFTLFPVFFSKLAKPIIPI